MSEGGARTRTRVWRWVRVVGGAAILALLVWRVGTGPFVDGVKMINAAALVAALAIGGLTTTANTRWSASDCFPPNPVRQS